MREIKFRGKVENTGKNDRDWVYGNLIQNEDASFIVEKVDYSFVGYCGECDKPFAEINRINPDTIGQYTGLKDIKDNEIYEGDIIRINDDMYDVVGKVIFKNAAWEVEWKGDNYLREDIWYWVTQRDIEVIGNIYEDKELVEVKE